MNKKDQINQIEQIRDIVFGSQMESYDKQFGQVQAKFEKKIDSLSKLIKETEESLAEKFEAELDEISDLISQYKKVNGKENQEFVKRLDKIDTRLTNSMSKQVTSLKDGLEKVKNATSRVQESLEELVSEHRIEIDKKIESEVSLIKKDFLTKSDFSEALLELSFRFSDEALASAPAKRRGRPPKYEMSN